MIRAYRIAAGSTMTWLAEAIYLIKVGYLEIVLLALWQPAVSRKGANGLAGASGLAHDSIAVSPVESVHSKEAHLV
jgi:hypothetical protein